MITEKDLIIFRAEQENDPSKIYKHLIINEVLGHDEAQHYFDLQLIDIMNYVSRAYLDTGSEPSLSELAHTILSNWNEITEEDLTVNKMLRKYF